MSTTFEPNAWREYDAAADQLACQGKLGAIGDLLPANMSVAALALINDDPEAFQERVRQCAYARAMERTTAAAIAEASHRYERPGYEQLVQEQKQIEEDLQALQKQATNTTKEA